MPFKTGLVYTLDCGEFGENLERALAMAITRGSNGAAKKAGCAANVHKTVASRGGASVRMVKSGAPSASISALPISRAGILAPSCRSKCRRQPSRGRQSPGLFPGLPPFLRQIHRNRPLRHRVRSGSIPSMGDRPEHGSDLPTPHWLVPQHRSGIRPDGTSRVGTVDNGLLGISTFNI